MIVKSLFYSILFTGIIFLSLAKPPGEKMTAGVLLTFDDRNMVNWAKQIPLFEKYDAHVTFFVDHFDELTIEQLQALKQLKNAGHTIASHGMRHRNAVKYAAEHSLEKYLSDEIVPALRFMNEHGFSPTAFAYPMSSRNAETDAALLGYFRYIRGGCPIEGTVAQTERFFVKANDIRGKGLLWGVSFHPHSKTDELVTQVKEAVHRLHKNQELMILYAHDIRRINEPGPKNFITVDALEEILAYAKKNHINFYSFDELP